MSPEVPASVLLALLLVGVAWCLCGAALLTLRRSDWAGWTVSLTGLTSVMGSVMDSLGHDAAGWRLLLVAAALGLPLSLTSYPRLRWRHPVDFLALVVVAGGGVLMTLQFDRPATLGTLGTVSGLIVFGHTWWRLERSTGRERRALQWMAFVAGSVALGLGLLTFAFEGPLQGAGSVLLLGLVASALVVGRVRPEIVDVRGVAVRVVVHAVVALSFVALFVAIVSLFDVLGGSALSIGSLALLGALVAMVVQPLRGVLRGVVDEVLFGHRPNPLDAATQVVGRFGGDVGTALHAVREALVLPYVALCTHGREVVASGELVPHTRSIMLKGAEAELVVGLRPGDLNLSGDDARVLRLVAPMLEQTMRAQALASQVQVSREALVGAVEEERRRLRRELHDELGPRLSGIAFTSDAARNLVRPDPAGAEQMLTVLRAETVTAIDVIRRLVYAMRPPAIDELGLVPALQQHAKSLRNVAGDHVSVGITTPSALPELPAAVEVAVYRIVTEALTNIARHTTSPTATVTLTPDHVELVVVITDAGGPANNWEVGVGLSSMRERAAEVGGTLIARATSAGGHVEAHFSLLT